MRRLFIYGLCSIAYLFFTGCGDEEVAFYKTQDCALNFSTKEVQYSYSKNMEKNDMVLQVPITVVGPMADYDREVGFKLLQDSSRNVSAEDYSIAPCSIKAGELSANLEVTVKYSEELADTSKRIAVQLVENEYFGVGMKGENVASVLWTDLLVRPHQTTIWRTWWFWFGRTYSRSFHELLITVFGDDVEITSYYSIASVTEEHPEFVRVATLPYWYAANRKLRDYVEAYDKAHPDAPLMHSDDAQYYSSYALGVGQGVSRAGYTIASTLDRRY